MIKVFTLNKNGKIELTKKELEQLLNESYWEGYKNNNNSYWTYTSPSFPYATGNATYNPYIIKANTLTFTTKSNLGD